MTTAFINQESGLNSCCCRVNGSSRKRRSQNGEETARRLHQRAPPLSLSASEFLMKVFIEIKKMFKSLDCLYKLGFKKKSEFLPSCSPNSTLRFLPKTLHFHSLRQARFGILENFQPFSFWTSWPLTKVSVLVKLGFCKFLSCTQSNECAIRSFPNSFNCLCQGSGKRFGNCVQLQC